MTTVKVSKICDGHKPMNEQLGYIAWHEWAGKQEKMGNRQKRCPVCKLYFYPSEF